MIIQAELRRKQSEYEGEACSVDIGELGQRKNKHGKLSSCKLA